MILRNGDGAVKITIIDIPPEEEEEVIIKANKLDDNLSRMIQTLKQGNTKLTGYGEDGIHLLEPGEIYYFESVDQKVFAYGKSEVYEIKNKLYELEKDALLSAFMRASKSTVLNLDKVKSFSPAFGGRFEAMLDNGEKTIISRQYVSILKERLGI